MPAYSVPRAHLHEEIAKIEARGEVVQSVTPDGATLIVVTAPPASRNAGGMETR